MQDNEIKLKSLREEIDEIDSKLIDLIDKRTQVVLSISSNKVSGSAIRTAREAEVLRKILTKTPNNFPKKAIIRIWRELISVYSQLQNSFSIGLCAPKYSVGYWDIARDYFGSASRIILYKSEKALLQKISDEPSFIGVFPHPLSDQDSLWWKNIGVGSNSDTNIIARLPYGGKSEDQFEELEAVAVASFPSEKSGKDRSWLIIEFSKQKSVDLLLMIIQRLGISGQLLSQMREGEGVYLYLLDVEGFFNSDTQPFNNSLKKEEDFIGIRSIGSYSL